MSFPRRDPAESLLAIARDDFFDAVEIKGYGNAEANEAARKILAQSHLKVCYGAPPRLLGPKLNPNAVDEEERKKAEATLMEAVDEAQFLGAGGIAFLAGKWEQETKDIAYAQLLKTTRNVCDYAAAKNMNVELEVFDFDMDKAALIGPAPYAARFAADMRMSHSSYSINFNPRSPCGERPERAALDSAHQAISIHAPRVGSDGLLGGSWLSQA